MSVAISLTTTNLSVYSFTKPFSIFPPLSSSSFTLVLSQSSNKPLFTTCPDVITVKSSMLPTGKANIDHLRRLFSRPGPHVFRDAVIPISLVSASFAEYLINSQSQTADVSSYFNKAISRCSGSQITTLLKSDASFGNINMIRSLIDVGGNVSCKDSKGHSLVSLAVKAGNFDALKTLIASGCVIDRYTDNYVKYAKNKQGKTPFAIAVNNGHSHLNTDITRIHERMKTEEIIVCLKNISRKKEENTRCS